MVQTMTTAFEVVSTTAFEVVSTTESPNVVDFVSTTKPTSGIDNGNGIENGNGSQVKGREEGEGKHSIILSALIIKNTGHVVEKHSSLSYPKQSSEYLNGLLRTVLVVMFEIQLTSVGFVIFNPIIFFYLFFNRQVQPK